MTLRAPVPFLIEQEGSGHAENRGNGKLNLGQKEIANVLVLVLSAGGVFISVCYLNKVVVSKDGAGGRSRESDVGGEAVVLALSGDSNCRQWRWVCAVSTRSKRDRKDYRQR